MDKLIIIGCGVAGVNLATELITNGYDGKLITIIDKGNNPYHREPSDIMTGFLGAGGWSDGKIIINTKVGGQLSKYCGDEKALELMNKCVSNFKKFHPKPEKIEYLNNIKTSNFLKPYFELRLSPTFHIGTDYLQGVACNWYEWLINSHVNFIFNTEVNNINLNEKYIVINSSENIYFDRCIICTGKSGIDFSNKVINDWKLPTKKKSVQIGVRFESDQKHFKKLLDIAYDFKLYRKENEEVSIRSFCVNSGAAYVAIEETYGGITFNGHARKDEKYKNNLINFGIMMEIKGIKNPFKWTKELVNKNNMIDNLCFQPIGIYWSPSGRKKSLNSENNEIKAVDISSNGENFFKERINFSFKGYEKYIFDFIDDLKKIFPTLKDDWGIYIPEVKYLGNEPIVNYKDLSLIKYPNIYFAGDSLSARGIAVSGAQGILIAENILKENRKNR